jgi:hypothetical protein
MLLEPAAVRRPILNIDDGTQVGINGSTQWQTDKRIAAPMR